MKSSIYPSGTSPKKESIPCGCSLFLPRYAYGSRDVGQRYSIFGEITLSQAKCFMFFNKIYSLIYYHSHSHSFLSIITFVPHLLQKTESSANLLPHFLQNCILSEWENDSPSAFTVLLHASRVSYVPDCASKSQSFIILFSKYLMFKRYHNK